MTRERLMHALGKPMEVTPVRQNSTKHNVRKTTNCSTSQIERVSVECHKIKGKNSAMNQSEFQADVKRGKTCVTKPRLLLVLLLIGASFVNQSQSSVTAKPKQTRNYFRHPELKTALRFGSHHEDSQNRLLQ